MARLTLDKATKDEPRENGQVSVERLSEMVLTIAFAAGLGIF
jgi:hypothetical protein